VERRWAPMKLPMPAEGEVYDWRFIVDNDNELGGYWEQWEKALENVSPSDLRKSQIGSFGETTRRVSSRRLHTGSHISSSLLQSCHSGISVWQWVALDSLIFHPGPPCPTFLRLTGGQRATCRKAVSGVARPHSGRPAAVFHPFGQRTPVHRGRLL
jgi:hypothetical protein